MLKERKKKFTELPKPFIVGVISDPDPENCIKTIKMSEYDGADAFDLQLHSLDQKFLNQQDLRAIISETTRPILSLYYRRSLKGPNHISDEDRLKSHFIALEAGAAGIDMEADYFDPIPGPPAFSPDAKKYSTDRNSPPREVTSNPKAIEKQMNAISEVHKRGGEVLLSAHTRIPLTSDMALKIAKSMESRGPDMIKIVGVCLNEEDVMENFKACITLKRELKIPFQIQAHGEYGKITRVVNPMLGSMLIFCNQSLRPGLFLQQPLIRNIKTIFQNLNWIAVTKPLEEEKFL
jgi:3-dehydroquinate dehydratase